MSGRRSTEDFTALRKQAKESVAKKMVERVAPIATRPVMPRSPEDMSRLNVKLANAGFRRENAANLFLASKTILGILLGAAAAIYTWGTGNDAQHIAGWGVFLAAGGFMAPNLWLSMAVSRRLNSSALMG